MAGYRMTRPQSVKGPIAAPAPHEPSRPRAACIVNSEYRPKHRPLAGTIPAVAKAFRFREDHSSPRASTGAAKPLTRRANPVAERSKHQQKIIKNYYENREAISLQRLSELVTELYLAEGKARQRQWTYIRSALEKLKVPESRIEHLAKQDNPALLAKLVEELMAKK
jgi:hypothetical protein